MVQDVEHIEPELQALAFGDLEALAIFESKRQTGSVAKNVLAQVALFSRKRILENDTCPKLPLPSIFGMAPAVPCRDDSGDRLQSAARDGSGRQSIQVLRRSDVKALRICDLHPFGPIEEVAFDVAPAADLTPHFVPALLSNSFSGAGSATSGTPFA